MALTPPARERIARRYLKHQPSLARQARSRLAEEDAPDPDAAQAGHDAQEAEVEEKQFVRPELALELRTKAKALGLFALGMPAESGGGLVVRLHECAGGSAEATLLAPSHHLWSVCDLLENPLPDSEAQPIGERGIRLSFKPFQIKTLLIKLIK